MLCWGDALCGNANPTVQLGDRFSLNGNIYPVYEEIIK
jgi:hypothetical protein